MFGGRWVRGVVGSGDAIVPSCDHFTFSEKCGGLELLSYTTWPYPDSADDDKLQVTEKVLDSLKDPHTCHLNLDFHWLSRRVAPERAQVQSARYRFCSEHRQGLYWVAHGVPLITGDYSAALSAPCFSVPTT